MDLAGIPGIAQIYITIIVGKVTAAVYPHLDLHNDYIIILAYAILRVPMGSLTNFSQFGPAV